MKEKIWVLNEIDRLIEEYYEEVKKECETYNDFSEKIHDLLWIPGLSGELDVTRDFLVRKLAAKADKEKNQMKIKKRNR